MKVYINDDVYNSIATVTTETQPFLEEGSFCRCIEMEDVPKDVLENFGAYSYTEKDGFYKPFEEGTVNVLEAPVTIESLIKEKEELLKSSLEAVNEYKEAQEMLSLGLTSTSTITKEEYVSWLAYRQELRDWIPSLDEEMPKR